ncbi:MAG TPA: DNA topoisomerase IB [Actinomycetales bacterium]|nr:DNA topoisomerase IB [Actinomycetales bacterium]
MVRLRRVSPRSKGYTRTRRGTGFSYTDADGAKLPPDELERVKSLAIPPAWTDVWICRYPNGHLQATGTDDAGRRQYLYHPDWRVRRDRSKFDRVTQAAAMLPGARRRIASDLKLEGMPLERVAAAAVRLLDVGYFRIGNDAYTDAHGSFGLTTLERQHVRKNGSALVFSFVGKSGISHSISVDDTAVIEVLQKLRTRRDESERLLAYKEGREWHDLTSTAVNEYLGELFGGALTAKDFRTWHATVIAAEVLALSEEPGESKASRNRAVKQAATEVAAYLGNTPTMAKNSYIDPRVVDAYESGDTIEAAARKKYRTAQARQAGLEKAVLELLAE